MIQRCLVILALLTAPALAEPAKPAAPGPKIDGTFGFDVMKPKQKCSKVAGPLLARLGKSYHCAAPDNGGQTGSGVTSVATCKAAKGHSEYMLFSTAADCDKERETQLANAG